MKGNELFEISIKSPPSAPPSDFYYICRTDYRKRDLATELKRTPKFRPTKDADFNQDFVKYVQDFYRDFPLIKDDLLKAARETFPELNVLFVDISGSFKRGNPNQDSDFDLKIFYTADISEDLVGAEFKTIWNNKWGLFDVHPQRIVLKVK